MKKLFCLFRVFLLVLIAGSTLKIAQADLVTNGTFRPDSTGVITGWKTLSDTTRMEVPPSDLPEIPNPVLCIVDAGGVTQDFQGLKGGQSYRLRFRAWRRGGDWSPIPILSVGGVTLDMARERITSPGLPHGVHDDVYNIDKVIRPGDGDFPLTFQVFTFMLGMKDLSHVWLGEISFVPVDEEVPLLVAPLENTAFWDRAILRTNRLEKVGLQITNARPTPVNAQVRLVAPADVEILDSPERSVSDWQRRDIYAPHIASYGTPRRVSEKNPSATLEWHVKAVTPGPHLLRFTIVDPQADPITVALEGNFESPLDAIVKADKFPAPKPADTGDIKVGAMFYPGWMPGSGWGWSLLDPYPHRKPALGYYDDSNPEVMDWQVKWALEHGISFFNFCWYRQQGNEGRTVKSWLGETLHDGFLKSSFINQFGFAITWENGNAGGISSKQDLLENLLPYWIENYFKHPSYLKHQGQPVVFIYSVNAFIAQLGGVQNVPDVLREMREQCRRAGLEGLLVAGEYRGDDPLVVKAIQAAGVDVSWSYGIKVESLKTRREWDLIPDIPTISVGWDPRPWQDYIGYWWTTHWTHTPTEYRKVAEETLKIMESYPKGSISRHIVQLDNWNEWGEGHYIAPSRHYGFAYLEAIRQVFSPTSSKPLNFLPDDIGLGGYESSYENWIASQKALLQQKKSQ